MTKSVSYDTYPVSFPPEMKGCWDGSAWQSVAALEVANFRSESSSHRPLTTAKLLYSSENLHAIFKVRDRYIRCIRDQFQDEVYKDSCVEFFVQPRAKRGYFNFEFNCGGALLAYHIVDPTRTPSGFKKFIPLSIEDANRIKIYHSLPQLIDQEIADDTVWFIEFTVPFSLFEKYVGPITPVVGQTWRGNFHKCADDSSHPHWASWAPVDELNFHLPRCFGYLNFMC
jgi:hypothetical protein